MHGFAMVSAPAKVDGGMVDHSTFLAKGGDLAVLSDVLCEVGVTDTAPWAGKGHLDHRAEEGRSRW
jgi:hypothetical protein